MSKLMIQDKRMPKKNGAKASAYNKEFIGLGSSMCVYFVSMSGYKQIHTHAIQSNWQEIADFLCRQLSSETQLTGEMKMISSVLPEFSS